MRIRFSIIMLLFAVCCFAQIPTVAGVSLGSTYESVENTLEQRYGTTFGKEHNTIKYYDIQVGGYYYKFSTFDFVYKSGARRLNLVELSRPFEIDDLARAKQFRDNIAETYGSKYQDMQSIIDKDGFKIYRCFLNNSEDYFYIVISLSKEKSKGGKTYYYVTVTYGPWWHDDTPDDI